jgi:putative ABC transport system ATP-binding protein
MIQLEGITRTFQVGDQPVHALVDVTESIAEGEHVAIMGPSGSGKSTLLNIVGCLDRPTSGSYRLNGRDVGVLEEAELTNVRRHEIGFVFQFFQLSGGERQRVALARATVMQPQILLADEPTGNLDSQSGRAVLDLLDQMNDDGLTLIVVTHDPKVAHRADRIVVLVDGRIERRVRGDQIGEILAMLAEEVEG